MVSNPEIIPSPKGLTVFYLQHMFLHMSNIFVFDLDNTVVEPISYKKENLFKDIDKDLGSQERELI